MVCCFSVVFLLAICLAFFFITWKPWSLRLMVRQLIASDGFGVGLGFVARYLEERDRMVDDRLWPNQWVDVLQIPKFSRQSSQYHHTSHHSPRISVAIHRIPIFFGDKEAWFPFFPSPSIHWASHLPRSLGVTMYVMLTGVKPFTDRLRRRVAVGFVQNGVPKTL